MMVLDTLSVLVCTCAVLSLFSQEAFAALPPGAVQLSSTTFDKVIPKFKAALVKFDKQNAYGDKQKQFKVVAEATIQQKELLVAEIAVQDRGKKENLELAERYDAAKKDEWPAYRLFIEGQDKPISFTGDVMKADEIQRFLVRETGLWLGLPGCLEEFDMMVKEFFISGNKKAVIERGGIRAGQIADETDKFRAEFYVKVMKNILEKGKDFIESELERVERLGDQKVSEAKKAQLKDRANILTSFQRQLSLKSKKDEL